MPDIDEHLIDDIRSRVHFYTNCPVCDIRVVKRYPLIKNLFGAHVLFFCYPKYRKFFSMFPFNYEVDHRIFVSGWEWARFSNNYCQYIPDKAKSYFNLKSSYKLCDSYDKAYIFGTGPSLSKAGNLDWSDGVRIVCNTIVKDKVLFQHINPHFFVAGDAVYHFSHTSFAKQFRLDLHSRMIENTNFYFVYPEIFDFIVRINFSEFENRLIPIPLGGPSKLETNLLENFRLPSLGNVLALLQLPLAFTFSQKVFMFGFDGRDPLDRQSSFWANSEKHSYPELMNSLKIGFPGFFEYYTPNNDSEKYIKLVHENLDILFLEVESKGRLIEMLHPSWTDSLNKRYKGNEKREEYFYGKND